MKTNNKIKILSIVIFVLIIALAFVVLNINKTGNAVKGLDKMNLGNNVTVEQTKEGTLTTFYWTIDNEDGTISSKKLFLSFSRCLRANGGWRR